MARKDRMLPGVDLSSAGLHDGRLTRDEDQIAALNKMIIEADGKRYDPDAVVKHWAGMPDHMQGQDTHQYKLMIYCDSEETMNMAIEQMGLRVSKKALKTRTCYLPDKEISASMQYTFDWSECDDS